MGKIRQIERVIGKKFVKAEIPSGFDVCEKQLFALVHKVHNVQVNDQQIEQYIPRIMDEFADLTKEEVIKRFASLEFNRFLDYYQNAPDLNAVFEDRPFRDRDGIQGDRTPRTGNSDYTRLFINLGSVDEFNRGDLLGYICNNTKISGRTVGKIDVKGVYSFFEVGKDDVNTVMEGFKGIQFKGREVRIEISGDGVSETRSGGNRRYDGGNRGGGERREGGFRERREGGYKGGNSAGGGFRDFSGKRREDRTERRKRY
jgi:ATP-dependent RNA helicase DeaD